MTAPVHSRLASHRIGAWGLAVALIASLGACGGGGGGPSVRVVANSPADGASGLSPVSGQLSVTVADTGLRVISSSLTLSCGGAATLAASSLASNSTSRQTVVTLSYEDLPAQTSCNWSGELDLRDAAGSLETRQVVNWAYSFSTGPAAALRYTNRVVALLDTWPAIISDAAPFVQLVRIANPNPSRGDAYGCAFGSDLTPSGRIPLRCLFSSAGGANPGGLRLNPASGVYAWTSATDPFPPNHEIGDLFAEGGTGFHYCQLCSVTPLSYRPDWLAGLAAPPIVGARAWAPDGHGGWYFVPNATPRVLQRRNAQGQDETIYTAPPGITSSNLNFGFTLLQTFSH